MDIMQSIEDIFGVFGVGIFALLCMYTLYGVAFCKIESIVKFYRDFLPATSTSKSTDSTKTTLYSGVYIAVAGIFIFGFGLIVQDTADKYTDTTVSGKNNSKNIIVQINNHLKILKNESDHRFSALVKKKNGKFELHPLGKSVFKHTEIFLRPNHFFEEKQLKFLYHVSKFPHAAIPEEFKKNDIKPVTSTVYYRSKNWAFSQPTYYDELKTLQIRVDFSRSILLISSLTIVGLVIALLISFVPLDRRTKQKYSSLRIKIFKNSVFLLVILMGICWMSRTGYDNSERNFNERVIGYYTSYLDNYSLYHPGKELYNRETEKQEKVEIKVKPGD